MVLLLTKLRVEVKKLVGRCWRAILLDRRLNNAQPELGHRLMVAARGRIRNMVGVVVCANSIPELDYSILEAMSHQVNISQLYVRAMMPLIKWKRAGLELFNEIVVVHGRQLGFMRLRIDVNYARYPVMDVTQNNRGIAQIRMATSAAGVL
jgi:hypothetical protein